MSDLHDDWRLHFASEAEQQRAAWQAEDDARLRKIRAQWSAVAAWLDQRDQCHVHGWVETLTEHDRALLYRWSIAAR